MPKNTIRRAPSSVQLRAALPLVSNDSARTWVHLAYEGTWKGHPDGDFSFTADTFNNIVALFNAQKNPVPLTYEHPMKGTGQPVPAAGWIHALEVKDGSLWGYVEFTPQAADMVKAGEYKFCSVVVDLESVDRESGDMVGPELYEVGLTNTPFLDGQKPITLSRGAVSNYAERASGETSKTAVASAYVALAREQIYPGRGPKNSK